MASVADAIFGRLQAVGAVTSLVGDRCYPVHLPANPTYPGVVYQRITRTDYPAMGFVDSEALHETWQVTSWASSYDGAQVVGAAVRVALKRFNGTAGGVVVFDVYLQNVNDLYADDVRASNQGVGVYGVAADFTIWFEEA